MTECTITPVDSAGQPDDWFNIEPSDRYNFVGDTDNNPKGYTSASIYVSNGGNIALVSEDGSTKVFTNVPDHWIFHGKVVRVSQSGTTATGILGMVKKIKTGV